MVDYQFFGRSDSSYALVVAKLTFLPHSIATAKGPTPHAPEGGFCPLAEHLHTVYGKKISCPTCQIVHQDARAFTRDEGGNGAAGLKRRQWKCRDTARNRGKAGVGCAVHSCSGYVRRAIATIGWDKVDLARKTIFEELGERGVANGRLEKPFSTGAQQPADDFAQQSPVVRKRAPTAISGASISKRARVASPRPTTATPASRARKPGECPDLGRFLVPSRSTELLPALQQARQVVQTLQAILGEDTYQDRKWKEGGVAVVPDSTLTSSDRE